MANGYQYCDDFLTKFGHFLKRFGTAQVATVKEGDSDDEYVADNRIFIFQNAPCLAAIYPSEQFRE